MEHVLSGLIEKRREIAGKIEHHHNTLRALIIDLDHVDSVIHLYDDSIELDEVKPKPFPPRHSAFRGEVSRIVLSTLRNAKKPLNGREIAMRVMAERGLDTADAKLVRLMAQRAGACLRDYRKKGYIQSEPGSGGLLVWSLSKAEPSSK